MRSPSACPAPRVTTYAGWREQLAIAQNVLDRHVTSSATGRCLECGVPGPCLRRETAAAVFTRHEQLPRRIPGLTRPDLVGARRIHPNNEQRHDG